MKGNLAPAAPAQETVKVRGLGRLAAAIFATWGALIAGKGLWDLGPGQPEANLYAPRPWAFVTRAEWARYARFELIYGLACAALAWYCLRWARRLPETVLRPRRDPEFTLFE